LYAKDLLENLGLKEEELKILEVAWAYEPSIKKKIEQLLKEV
jgi:hypothetical protein